MSDLSSVDYKVEESQSSPRSVYDFASNEELRDALSSAPGSSPESEHLPFDSEPDPDLDLDWRVDNIDRTNSYEQTVQREMNRLLVLKSFLDLDYEKLIAEGCAFDGITRLARKYFNVPICNIVLLDIGRLWILSQEGKQFNMMRRKDTFCSHVIVSKEECYVVPDATKNWRLKDFPYVTAESGVRFYAACPLKAPEGCKIGTFCIMDVKPHEKGLSEEDQVALKDFARLTMEALVHQRELHRQHEELKAAARRIASASHDLVTPLSVVQLSMSLLNEDSQFLGRLEDKQRDCLLALSSSSDKMAEVCQSLKVSRIASDMKSAPPQAPETGEMVESTYVAPALGCPAQTETSSLLKRLGDVSSAIVDAIKVPLSLSIDPNVPKVWVGDEIQMLHLCIHILVRAMERTSCGSVHFAIKFRETKTNAPELLFECSCSMLASDGSFSDDVIGIFDELVLSSFSETVQQDRERDNQDGRSSPVGILSTLDFQNLASHDCFPMALTPPPNLDPIAVQIRALGGCFGVSGRADSQMTCFWFSVPLMLPEDFEHRGCKRRHDELVATKPLHQDTFMKRALIIDDSIVMRKMLSRALEQLGYRICQAADGMEGLQNMQEQIYDLVLLDFLMPVMDGLDCVRIYRRWEQQHRPGYHQVICGMSAHASLSDVERGLGLGMTDYRPKPLSLDDLKKLGMRTPAKLVRNIDMVDATGMNLNAAPDASEGGRKLLKLDSMAQVSRVCHIATSGKVCLIAASEENASRLAGRHVLESDWSTCLANSWSEAKSLLRARNWDAVLVDVELLGANDDSSAIACFRDWEASHRVHRQQNIILMYRGLPRDEEGPRYQSVHVPSGYDGAVELPARPTDLASILEGFDQGREHFGESDIITSL